MFSGNKFNMRAINACTLMATFVAIAFTGFFFSEVKAAANCTGPTYDAATKTLSLVCTESDEVHELSCSHSSNPETLFLSVNSVSRTITCPPVIPPNTVPAVSINGPATGDYGQNLTFTLTANDAEGDTSTFYVDWGMDGTADYVSGVVGNNTGHNVANSWTAVGVQTFQAKAIDAKGGDSGWVTRQVTINNPPAPTATLEASINGGAWTVTNPTVDPGDTVSLRWTSQNATSCSGSGAGFDTGNSPNGTDPVTPPGPNSNSSYSASCTGPGGSGSDSITVTTRQSPNLSTPNVTYTLSSSFNAVTGLYDYIDVTFNTTNNGGSDTKASANYEFQFDRNRDGYDHTVTGSIGTLAVGQTVTRTERVSGNIPFGNNRIRVFVDNTNAVTEVNEGDNVRVLDLTVPPPNPGLNLIADRYQVRNGETVTLDWSTAIAYPMNCRVYGPGIDVNPSGVTGNRTTAPINAKSEYTFTCTEPVTGTTFTDRVVVETQGSIEEI
jgi:hypothetical protein